MRLKFTNFTRRPAFLAVLAGASMVYLAIYKFDIPTAEVGQVALMSLVLVLVIAVPAGILVAAIKWIKYLREKEQ